MRNSRSKQNLLRIAVVGLLFIFALPATAFADKRGRGRNRDFDKRARKCGKFINCHDARDGRWDGRGPRGDFDNRSRRLFRNDRFRDRFESDRFRDRLQRRDDRFYDRFNDRDDRDQARFQRRLKTRA